jgi:hypothetical protein
MALLAMFSTYRNTWARPSQNSFYHNYSYIRPMTNPTKYYLVGYNVLAFCSWLAYLISFALSGGSLGNISLVLLNIAQGLAVLEIAHIIFKLVKSPLASTIAQVFSRLLVLVLIDYFRYQQIQHQALERGILVVSLAWGITELVRYSFYATQLLNSQPRALLWMRYTFFIVLYPVGVFGEWLIIATPIFISGMVFNPYNVAMAFVLLSYVYYFPVLYKYMWKQRKAKL